MRFGCGAESRKRHREPEAWKRQAIQRAGICRALAAFLFDASHWRGLRATCPATICPRVALSYFRLLELTSTQSLSPSRNLDHRVFLVAAAMIRYGIELLGFVEPMNMRVAGRGPVPQELELILPDLQSASPELEIKSALTASAGADRELCLPAAERIAGIIHQMGGMAMVQIAPQREGFAVVVSCRQEEISKEILGAIINEAGSIPLIIQQDSSDRP